MIRSLKKRLYFVVAHYFAFWARFVLWRWRPRIVIITGSSGKTTVLHLVEAQLGDKAQYSHHANGAIGIPFHILGMETNVPSKAAWFSYFVSAPFHAFRKVPKQKLYIVEADCDRPNEGKFTSRFLKPEVTIWVSSSNTHSMNFDRLVKSGQFKTHTEAIAHEFGFFAQAAKKLVLAGGDQTALTAQLTRVSPNISVKTASIKDVSDYELSRQGSTFKIKGSIITIPELQPKKLGVSLQLVNGLLEYLGEPFDSSYSKFLQPPGRSNIIDGKNNVTIIDSTYNNGLDAITGILELFESYPAKTKWLLVADILEQGPLDKSEHEELARVLASAKVDRLILLGQRTAKYTYPLLKSSNIPVESFESPKDVLDYLISNLKGGETLLFKGAQGLEGVIEQLLADPSDAANLVRREAIWVKRRKNWGLPR